jgi:hypothetical protein
MFHWDTRGKMAACGDESGFLSPPTLPQKFALVKLTGVLWPENRGTG